MITRSIGQGLESAAHDVARRVLGKRRLPIRELRNKAVLGRSALALRRFEDAEVSRLSGHLTPPYARAAVVTATYRRPELLLSSVPEMRADWLDEVLAKRMGAR